MKSVVCSCVLAAMLCCRVQAQDHQDPVDPSSTRTLSVFAELGPAAPFGWLGVGLETRPVPWSSLQLGGGLGLGGPQAALGGTVHFPLSTGTALGLLLAVSWERYLQTGGLLWGHEFDKLWDSSWGYFGIQGRTHLAGRFFVRATIGGTTPITWWRSSCTATGADDLRACEDRDFNGTLSVFGAFGFGAELL